MTETTVNNGAMARSTIRRTVWEWDGNYTRSVIEDVRSGLGYWPLWVRLGWQDVMLRYRRSMIGPFWLTISMGIMVFSLGLFYGELFGGNDKRYLPFLTVGFLVWGLITSVLSEGCQTFIESEGFIRQIDLPLSMFPLRVIWRNLIIFFHNSVIYVVVAIIFDVTIDWSLLLVIPGLLLILANAVWSAALLGVLSARFRDLPQIVASLLQIAFFITPIIWMPESMPNRPLLMEGNPFYHFIELLRAPMLGHPPTLLNWTVALAITLGGWAGTFLFYRRFHSRIAYWV
jgi:ABC-2 type transport system permease protein/lipopolysaccharide transport system permease protein